MLSQVDVLSQDINTEGLASIQRVQMKCLISLTLSLVLRYCGFISAKFSKQN